MDNNDNRVDQPPDLASVLRTLAALAPKNDADLQGPAQISSSPLVHPPVDPRRIPQTRSNISLRPSFEHKDDVSPPPFDPTSILEWPKGLRCVTRIAAQNPYFVPAIRKMIADQEKHERMWWQSRSALAGKYGNPDPNQMPEQMRKELEVYDGKVHAASKELVSSMEREFKRLGVPFFGVRPELVKPSTSRGEASTSSEECYLPEDSAAGISDVDLLKLQRKMIQYLEDMYKE